MKRTAHNEMLVLLKTTEIQSWFCSCFRLLFQLDSCKWFCFTFNFRGKYDFRLSIIEVMTLGTPKYQFCYILPIKYQRPILYTLHPSPLICTEINIFGQWNDYFTSQKYCGTKKCSSFHSPKILIFVQIDSGGGIVYILIVDGWKVTNW